MITCGGRDAGKSIFEIDFDPQGEISRDGFRERHGLLVHGGGERVVQRIAHTDAARRELERTVRTADVLVRRLGITSYPPELSRVIGYRPDGRAPYLVATRRGRPLSEMGDRLPLEAGQLWAVVDGILAVLRHLNDLRLVHRDIRPGTLWWDGTTVQLADFGLTLDEGEPRGAAAGTDPWRSPEQAKGQGRADCRDDVYSAGTVFFHLATGEEATTAADMRDRVRWLDAGQRTLLEGVFTDEARQRVSAYTLRLRRDTQAGRSTGPGPGTARPPRLAEVEQQARQHFHELRARQHAFSQRQHRQSYPQPPATSPRPGLVTPFAARRAVVLSVAAAVLVLGALIAVLALT
ncbi:protein kinase [Streptomyces sp. NPDC007205]|uniref:protein kinase domain-containing protein n=1 Tax=Streptomyces sp. NPDC007205 TaxID=3154316 RepID=UPI00340B03F4